jgi:RecJ-like exonuclease
MKTKSQIIAEQKSIGNVEISEEQYNRLTGVGEMRIWMDNTFLNFAPREVVHPEEKIGCGAVHILGFTVGYKNMDEMQKDCNRITEVCGDFNLSLNKVILCPSCQKKKDNHSSEITAHLESKDEEPYHEDNGSDIQSPKVFEDNFYFIKVNAFGIEIIDKSDLGYSYCFGRSFSLPLLIDAVNYYQEKWGKIER